MADFIGDSLNGIFCEVEGFCQKGKISKKS